VGGTRIIDRVAAALRPVADQIVIAASARAASHWLPGVPAIPDILEGSGGAAAGIHAALRACGTPILAVGWDMPFVVTPLLRLVSDRAQEGEFDAVVPAGVEAGTVEPLCAWYAPEAAGAIEVNWARGQRGLHELVAGLRSCILPNHVVATIGSVERLFHNVNTPSDLKAARSLAEEA
jgi:molybdopterin-guanine dinucleotide biosynthesis protein A